MGSGARGATSRHLRDLFGQGAPGVLDDGQLLARYRGSRDEDAFEAMMARHGPMVLATCRAILKHEHDVEDTFQATFFVLARKAASVRTGESLGGWLHRVAYRAAMQASLDRQSRRRMEAGVAASLSTPRPEADLPSVVHEELDRLPDRERLPVILCDLEGLTYEQAAHHLSWTEPTLRHRLVRARKRLRDRLIRQGFHAGAVGCVLAEWGSAARSDVPHQLARATVAGAGSTVATTLTRTVIRSLLMTKLKLASAVLLAGLALATSGVIITRALQADEPNVTTTKSRQTVKSTSKSSPIGPQVPAEAGSGIEGRILDLEGRPVAGARVELANLMSAPEDNLTRWLDRAREQGVGYPLDGLTGGGLVARSVHQSGAQVIPPTPEGTTATTGPDGRFRLSGIGPNQVAEIRVSGAKVATTQFYAVGRDGAEVPGENSRGIQARAGHLSLPAIRRRGLARSDRSKVWSGTRTPASR